MSRSADAPNLPDDPPDLLGTAEAAKPHHTGHRGRLRRRFLSAGADALADYELLEMLLFGAIPRRDVKPLAKQLIDQFGSLGGVLNADPLQLERRAGLSTAAIATVRLVAAMSQRMLHEAVREQPLMSNWTQVLDYLNLAMKYEPVEQLRLLFLDRRNRLIADEVQQRGTVDQAPAYPREVARRSLDLNASAVLLVHNHPSGDPEPSRADIDMTREIAAALKAVGVTLHDHLIIGRAGHASFRALGLM